MCEWTKPVWMKKNSDSMYKWKRQSVNGKKQAEFVSEKNKTINGCVNKKTLNKKIENVRMKKNQTMYKWKRLC